MYPPLFGSLLWDTLLVVALNFPKVPQDLHKRYFKDLIYGVIFLTPCPQCAGHGVEYVKSHPPEVNSTEEAVKYVVDFHNSTNKRLGKAEFTVEEATKAIVMRMSRDFKDMPLIQQRRVEDSKRITELQAQVQKLQGGGTIHSFTGGSDVFLYVSISLLILVVILIIVIAVMVKHRRRKD